MKLLETIPLAKKRHFVVMLLCFAFGGFSLISFVFHASSVFLRPDPSIYQNSIQVTDINAVADFREGNRMDRFQRNPGFFLASPNTLAELVGGVISIAAGITILGLLREKEHKSIKQQAVSSLLLPDEAAVIEVLKESNYESTQSKIVKQTGLGKVQVHRAIKRLETKGIVEKHEFGMTNKVFLKKGIVD